MALFKIKLCSFLIHKLHQVNVAPLKRMDLSPTNVVKMATTLFDRIFRDENGGIVVAQAPNLPLIVWIVASLSRSIFADEKFGLGLEYLAFGSLFTWAWQELLDGVNYFRRALGFFILVSVMTSKILVTQ